MYVPICVLLPPGYQSDARDWGLLNEVVASVALFVFGGNRMYDWDEKEVRQRNSLVELSGNRHVLSESFC